MLRRLAVLAALIAGPAWAGLMVGSPSGGTIPDDVTLPVSSTPVGAVSADAFTGWTNPADIAFDSTSWTSPSTSIRYLRAGTATSPIATTVGQWRDVEVTTWARNGCVYIRYSAATDTAIYFNHNGDTTNGTLRVGVATNITPGGVQASACLNQSEPNAGLIYNNTNLVGTVTGYSKTDTAGDTFTFGCSAWECYAEFNGVEFWRSDPEIVWPMAAGNVMLSSTGSANGFRDVTVNWMPLATIYSNPAVASYDLRDFGVSSFTTTGSITGGTGSLVVSDASGFEIGDSIIVACGYESGACARGTTGVGGTWPALHYADAAAMNADHSQPANTYAYLDTDDTVRKYTGSAWQGWVSGAYYFNFKTPRALLATITNISGNTITLDTNASVTATNAPVYFDNTDIINSIFQDGFGNSSIFPIGDYYFPPNLAAYGALGINLPDGTEGNRPTLLGNSIPTYTLIAPDGAPGITLAVANVSYAAIGKDGENNGIYIRNNAGQTHFGMNWTTNGFAAPLSTPLSVYVATSSNVNVYDSGAYDGFAAVQASHCDTCNLVRSYARVTQEPIGYITWQIQIADSEEGAIIDGEVDSNYFIPGIEIFRSDGADITRPVTRNASVASNSSGDWLMDTPYVVIENDSKPADTSLVTLLGIQASSNISPPSPSMLLGGEIRNPTIIMGFPSPAEVWPGISIEANVPNIRVTGTYPTCVSPIGLIQYPSSGVSLANGLFVSDGDNTTITGIRVDADNGNTLWGDVNLKDADSSIEDSVADNVTGIGTETDVITNAAYEALCP